MDLTIPVTQAFAEKLPKIEVPAPPRATLNLSSTSVLTSLPQLHAHLSGSISRQCLHKIWAKKKALDPDFSIEDPWVIMPLGKVDYTLQTCVPASRK